MLGLVCDPVAGLVEVPCVKRNAAGASNAIISADMALAGVKSRIPTDEVIEAMYKIGQTMPSALRETGYISDVAYSFLSPIFINTLIIEQIHDINQSNSPK